MKKALFTAAILVSTLMTFANPTNNINEKVLTAFNANFKNANQVVWHEYNNFYEVRFVEGTTDTRIKYDKKGNVLETVRYYTEEGLPLFVKVNLKNKFADKKIYGVTEIAKASDLNYIIILEDETTWTTVKSDYFGNSTVEKKYTKALTR